jgi:hypothetical protein
MNFSGGQGFFKKNEKKVLGAAAVAQAGSGFQVLGGGLRFNRLF